MRRRRKRRREGKIRRGRKLIAIQKNWRTSDAVNNLTFRREKKKKKKKKKKKHRVDGSNTNWCKREGEGRRERQRDGNTGRRNEDGDREKEDRIEEGRTLRSGRG